MPYTTSSDIRIAYDDLGAGDTALLLLPGWCATRGAFAALAPLLARKHRVLALDWRGHGGSGPAPRDFGEHDLVEDALAVIRASGVRRVIPVATAHAGWVAIELRRKLGARVPLLVLLDWIVTPAPPPFLAGLAAIQDERLRAAALQGLFASWRAGGAPPEVDRLIEQMGAMDADMWTRGCREIAASYARAGSPLDALAKLDAPVPVLHAWAQPDDEGFRAAQAAFAKQHAWYAFRKLSGRTHFPTVETPDEVARAIQERLGETGAMNA